MAWQKEQREAIEALEDAEAILQRCLLAVSSKWNMSGPAMSKFCAYLNEELSRVHAQVKKAWSTAYPGGREYEAGLRSRKAVSDDIRFALRRLQERKYEGSVIDGEAVARLERALEKLGAGDG